MNKTMRLSEEKWSGIILMIIAALMATLGFHSRLGECGTLVIYLMAGVIGFGGAVLLLIGCLNVCEKIED